MVFVVLVLRKPVKSLRKMVLMVLVLRKPVKSLRKIVLMVLGGLPEFSGRGEPAGREGQYYETL